MQRKRYQQRENNGGNTMNQASHPYRNVAAPLFDEPRSMLFVPGDDLAKLSKIPSLTADIIVVDLEDAIAAHHKAVARTTVNECLSQFDQSTLSRIAIRVNPTDTTGFEEDLLLCGELGVRGIIIPKLADAEIVTIARHSMSLMGRANTTVFAGIESLAGVRNCFTLLASGVNGVYFGAEDFVEEIGGLRTESGLEVLYVRSQVVLAAKLAGIAAIDQAVTAVHDIDQFRADAATGRALGYTGKICLHPAQATASNEVFSPSPGELERAQRIAAPGGAGVQLVDGNMVDAVHRRAAKRLLARHQQILRDDGHPKTPSA
jgi:citrate lyase subunit beta/citryl-CoA lyase